MTRPTTKSAKLGLQALEAREVPATVDLDPVSKILTVTGTGVGETITVRQTASAIKVDGISRSFALSAVNEVWVKAGGGNDTVDLQKAGAVVTKKAVVWGEAGNDTVRGGNGVDYLDGGSGNDKLSGFDGADKLAGDAGCDTLLGGAKNDDLAGGDGNDRLQGDGGADRMDGGRGDDVYVGAGSGDNVHDTGWVWTTKFENSGGYTHHYDLLGNAVRSDFGWFDEKLADATLRREVRTAERDGVVGHAEMAAVLDRAGADAAVSAAEFEDLNTLTAAIEVTMSDATRNLAGKVVRGDLANLWFTGGKGERVPLGNLTTGATGARLHKLVDKWFRGLDRPMAKSHDRATLYDYRAAAGPLFDAAGPGAADINQGDVGDCYFAAGLGAVARQDPQRLRDMFTPNDDGTVTVRFFNDGKAEYVTVDRWLPVSGPSKRPAFAGVGTKTQDGAEVRRAVDDGTELWVALAEKAYAQANESCWVDHQDGTNSYNGIGGKITPNAAGKIDNPAGLNGGGGGTAMEHIAGVGVDNRRAVEARFADLKAAFIAGKAITFGTPGVTASPKVVGSHVYFMTGYDDANKKIILRNPWGGAGADVGLTMTEVWGNFESFAVAAV